ncbi:hypothetical protein KI387_031950, partial [Taxus chinensis]
LWGDYVLGVQHQSYSYFHVFGFIGESYKLPYPVLYDLLVMEFLRQTLTVHKLDPINNAGDIVAKAGEKYVVLFYAGFLILFLDQFGKTKRYSSLFNERTILINLEAPKDIWKTFEKLTNKPNVDNVEPSKEMTLKGVRKERRVELMTVELAQVAHMNLILRIRD